MNTSRLKALVVDDDAAIRRLTARALSNEGFSCDLAGDGVEAQSKLGSEQYDLVVTDLCMPNRNGHALASELVERADRPLVVVVTALTDPRMTKDLLTRGVDDVVLKPVDYFALAAKLRALVNRRSVASQRETLAAATATAPVAAPATVVARKVAPPPKAPVITPLSMREFEIHLAKVAHILPLSQHTLDVSQLAQSKKCNSQELAMAVESEAGLAVEVLRLANSCYFKPGGSRIVELVEAIPRVGHRRVGELALSMHALRLLNVGNLPWMDRELAWRRSIAAGLAVDLLVAQGNHAAIQNGLFLAASMHGLGRVILGLLFQQHYDAFVEACREGKQSMQEHESRVFPVSQAAGMARLLQTWSVSPDVFQPLRYLLDDFNAIARFAEPLRSKLELVKLAVLLAWLADGAWEPWDMVELAPHAAFKRLRIADPVSVLRELRDSMSSLKGNVATPVAPNGSVPPQAAEKTTHEVRYHRLASESYDPLPRLFETMDLAVIVAPETTAAGDEAVVVNCLDASPSQVVGYCKSDRFRNSILLGNCRQLDQYASKCQVVRLPASYAALRAACEQATA